MWTTNAIRESYEIVKSLVTLIRRRGSQRGILRGRKVRSSVQQYASFGVGVDSALCCEPRRDQLISPVGLVLVGRTESDDQGPGDE